MKIISQLFIIILSASITSCTHMNDLKGYATFDESSSAKLGYQLVKDNGGEVKRRQHTEFVTVATIPLLSPGEHILEFNRDEIGLVADPNRPTEIVAKVTAMEDKQYQLSKICDGYYEIIERKKNSQPEPRAYLDNAH